MPRVRLYAAMSLDGYIADAGGGTDWLAGYDARKYGFDAFLGEVGAVVMGRRTFEQVTTFDESWPYAGKRAIVMTSRRLARLPAGAAIERGGIAPAVEGARQATSGDVWIVGGAMAMRTALEAQLVDRIDLTMIPVVLGGGIPLLGEMRGRHRLSFENVEIHKDSVVRLTYLVERAAPPG